MSFTLRFLCHPMPTTNSENQILKILFHKSAQVYSLKNLHLAKAISKRLTPARDWSLPIIHYLEKRKPKRLAADINKTASNITLSLLAKT